MICVGVPWPGRKQSAELGCGPAARGAPLATAQPGPRPPNTFHRGRLLGATQGGEAAGPGILRAWERARGGGRRLAGPLKPFLTLLLAPLPKPHPSRLEMHTLTQARGCPSPTAPSTETHACARTTQSMCTYPTQAHLGLHTQTHTDTTRTDMLRPAPYTRTHTVTQQRLLQHHPHFNTHTCRLAHTSLLRALSSSGPGKPGHLLRLSLLQAKQSQGLELHGGLSWRKPSCLAAPPSSGPPQTWVPALLMDPSLQAHQWPAGTRKPWQHHCPGPQGSPARSTRAGGGLGQNTHPRPPPLLTCTLATGPSPP